MSSASSVDVEKSSSDQREYRHIELPNGLRCVLASDSSTEKSSAALDVNVGHFSDPEDVAGLAHFCEHMLFLGTEKYPDESEYNQYLNQHGGAAHFPRSAGALPSTSTGSLPEPTRRHRGLRPIRF